MGVHTCMWKPYISVCFFLGHSLHYCFVREGLWLNLGLKEFTNLVRLFSKGVPMICLPWDRLKDLTCFFCRSWTSELRFSCLSQNNLLTHLPRGQSAVLLQQCKWAEVFTLHFYCLCFSKFLKGFEQNKASFPSIIITVAIIQEGRKWHRPWANFLWRICVKPRSLPGFAGWTVPWVLSLL